MVEVWQCGPRAMSRQYGVACRSNVLKLAANRGESKRQSAPVVNTEKAGTLGTGGAFATLGLCALLRYQI